MLRTKCLFFSVIAMVIIFSLPLPVIGQSVTESTHTEMQEAWQAFKAYLIDQKHEAIAHGKELLQKADTRIEELESEAAKASGDTKTRYQQEIKNLKEKRANAAKKLDELEDASADAWDSTKEGFVKAYRALYDAWHEAVEKFK
jgi:peptidoglycan hydrolase CwlO-like protein